MKETSNEPDYGDLQAQIQTLQSQLQDLNSRLAAPPSRLFGMPKGLVLAALVLLVLCIGAAAAAAGVDALTIGPDGKVGINRPKPMYDLDVDGSARISGPIEATKLDVGSKEASVSITGKGLDAGSGSIKGGSLDANTGKIGGNLTVGGKISGTAGSPPKLDVTGNVSLSGTHLIFDSQNGVIDWGDSQGNGNLHFRTLAKQGEVGGYTDRMIIDHNGNVTISGNINGEKPPESFNFSGRSGNAPWNHKETDLQNLCGDLEGCRIRMWMQDVNTSDVRGMEFWLFMQPSGNSRRGYTKNLWNDEWFWALGTADRKEILRVHDWCWAYNFPKAEWNRVDGNPYSGTTVSFVCKPYVTAYIKIYDR